MARKDDDKRTPILSPGTWRLMERLREERCEALRDQAEKPATQQPPEAPAPLISETTNEPISSKAWCAAEFANMRERGELPAKIEKTELALLLHRRMIEAAKTDVRIRPIKAVSISNKLAAWGLWPLSLIK